jgi:hypothetical protein
MGDVQQDVQRSADSDAAGIEVGASAFLPSAQPSEESPPTMLEQVCPNPRCGRALDAESVSAHRCRSCKCALAGNQFTRKYPKPPTENPAVQQQLADRCEEIIEQLGGRDHLAATMITLVGRFAVLEAFVESWESYFMKSGPITRQGRVRSGYGQGYLSSLAQLQRLATLIGVERRLKEVTESPAEWLERISNERNASEDADADHEPEPEAQATDENTQTGSSDEHTQIDE